MNTDAIVVMFISCLVIFFQTKQHNKKIAKMEAIQAVKSILNHFDSIRFSNRKDLVDLVLSGKVVLKFNNQDELFFFTEIVAPVHEEGYIEEIKNYEDYWIGENGGKLSFIKKGSKLITGTIIPWDTISVFLEKK